MSAISDAERTSTRAQKFRLAAEAALTDGLFDPSASNAIIAGINAKDAMCLPAMVRRRVKSADGWPTPQCATWCYPECVSLQPEISQRDLRLRSKEIMDSVERGQAFTVTRDGHQIGELIPLRRRRTFVPRGEFLTSSGSCVVDPARFRRELDVLVDDEAHDAYGR